MTHKPIENETFNEPDQRIRNKNLELMRALQDVDRLKSENVQYKLDIIDLKEKNQELLQLVNNYYNEKM